MTPEAQRIAIAESDGWAPLSKTTDGYQEWMTPDLKQVGEFDDLPDYLNDRDAIQEAMSSLTDDEKIRFIEHLKDICKAHQNSYRSVWAKITATPAQLCEAYLKTKGLWDES